MATIISSSPVDLSTHLAKLAPRRRNAAPANSLPVPETPALPAPPGLAALTYNHPSRRILSRADHEVFLRSSTYELIVSFVFSLADAVQDRPVSSVREADAGPVITIILDVLDQVFLTVSQCPPEDQEGSRFGNKGFRDFIDALELKHEHWHRKLGIQDAAAVDEVATYFLHSFGNRTRIDYGSGHELNFITWL